MANEQEKPEAPRLPPEIKKMNGKSGKRLSQCIDSLNQVLDENDDPLIKKDISN